MAGGDGAGGGGGDGAVGLLVLVVEVLVMVEGMVVEDGIHSTGKSICKGSVVGGSSVDLET